MVLGSAGDGTFYLPAAFLDVPVMAFTSLADQGFQTVSAGGRAMNLDPLRQIAK